MSTRSGNLATITKKIVRMSTTLVKERNVVGYNDHPSKTRTCLPGYHAKEMSASSFKPIQIVVKTNELVTTKSEMTKRNHVIFLGSFLRSSSLGYKGRKHFFLTELKLVRFIFVDWKLSRRQKTK